MTTIPKYSAEHQAARERVLNDAIRAGKILPSRYQHWAAQYDADPQGTAQVIAQLASAPGVAATSGTPSASPEDKQYEPGWLTQAERRRVSAANGGQHTLVTHGQD